MKIYFLVAFILMYFACKGQELREKQDFPIVFLGDMEFMEGTKIILDKIYYEQGNIIPTLTSLKYLDSLAVILKRNRFLKVELTYIQLIWPKTMGIDFSNSRAESLKEYLIDKNIEPARIFTRSTNHLVDPNVEELNKKAGEKKYQVEAIFIK